MKPNENKNNDIIVEDETFGMSAEKAGISFIALEQFRRCCQAGSKLGTEVGTDSFTNAVNMLLRVLQKYIEDDEEMKKEVEEVENLITSTIKSFTKRHEDLMKQSNSRNVDWERTNADIERSMEKELRPLNEEKFGLLSKMLNKLNYFGDSGSTA